MAELLMVNPRKRRRKSSTRRRRRNPTTSLQANPRRRRRNPIDGRGMKNIMNQVTTAAIMASGGVVTDMITAKLPLPADMKTGNMAPLARAGVAVGLGIVLDKGLKQRKIATDVTQGALVVIAHDFITKQFGQRLGLSAYEEMSAYEELGDYSDLLLETDIAGMGDNDLLGIGYDEGDELGEDLLGLGAGDEFNDIVAMSAYDEMDGMGEYENAASIAQYDDEY